jgi:hypothetical protein
MISREIQLNCGKGNKQTIVTAKIPPKVAKVWDMIAEVHTERLERLNRIGSELAQGLAFEVEWRKHATILVQEELSALKDMVDVPMSASSAEIQPNDVF